MVILSMNNDIFSQVMIRDSGIRQSDIAKEVNSVNGFVDGFISPILGSPFLSEALGRRVSGV